MEEYPPEYYQFFISFNSEDFYTCHDLLEDIWMSDKGNLFIKGLLQMCVGLYHYSYGNLIGAISMLNVAQEYLNSYRPYYWNLDVDRVLEHIKECLAIIPAAGEKRTTIKELPALPTLHIYLR